MDVEMQGLGTRARLFELRQPTPGLLDFVRVDDEAILRRPVLEVS